MRVLNKPRTALNWFSKAYMSNHEAYEPIYALSVLLYKIEKYKLSLDFAYQWMNTGVDIEEVQLNLKYLIAINWK